MILKMTLHNKKETMILASFANLISLCENYHANEPVSDKIRSCENAQFEGLKMLITRNIADKKEIETFEAMVVSHFKYYCYESPFSNFTDEECEKLTANFEATVESTLIHRNENGESVYVFFNIHDNYAQFVIL